MSIQSAPSNGAMNAIIVIRHAQPVDCNDTASSHWTDTELTEMGRRQAQCLADRLRREIGSIPCVLHSSDLRRAFQTAEPVAKALGVPIIPQPGLREFNNGLAAGETEEALGRFVPVLTQAHRDLLANPAGETWTQFHQRIAACMDRITAGEGRLTLVVAHYGAIINILHWWLRLGLTETGDTPASFDASLASIAVLRRSRQGKPAIERLNDTSHLLADGLTGPMKLTN